MFYVICLTHRTKELTHSTPRENRPTTCHESAGIALGQASVLIGASLASLSSGRKKVAQRGPCSMCSYHLPLSRAGRVAAAAQMHGVYDAQRGGRESARSEFSVEHAGEKTREKRGRVEGKDERKRKERREQEKETARARARPVSASAAEKLINRRSREQHSGSAGIEKPAGNRTTSDLSLSISRAPP